MKVVTITNQKKSLIQRENQYKSQHLHDLDGFPEFPSVRDTIDLYSAAEVGLKIAMKENNCKFNFRTKLFGKSRFALWCIDKT